MPTTNLIRFIESHGNTAKENADGTLTVSCQVSVNGVASVDLVTIPATLAAARGLLGY
ncbi:hypothetical protein [Cupriavidus necator]